MVQENLNAFWDTFMHAICIQLRSQWRLLIRKGLLKKGSNTTAVKEALDSFIEQVKDNAEDYQKHLYQDLFLPSVMNRVIRAPIYPFVPVPEKNPDDGLPNYLNPMGRLIQTIITRGVLNIDVAVKPCLLSWESWQKLDLDAWKTDNPELRDAYRNRSTVKEKAKTRGPARKRLKSPLECALTGLPIFPGDMVYVAFVVLRDSLSGSSGTDQPPLEESSHCLLFHAEVKGYLYDKTSAGSTSSGGGGGGGGAGGFVVDHEEDSEGSEKETELHEASRAIISSFLNSLSIIADSYYHNLGEGSKMNLDYSRGTTVWISSQARSFLSSIELPLIDEEALEAPLRYILKRPENLEYFMSEILYLDDSLETIGEIYAQQKFAIYTVRHLMGMNEF
jgi:hypothetical protein